ncbi:MAG: alcohol dehydrogenase catalytic domain-containing protein [Deltaproteobacteria bacterium]|nr:alcohol dehydrogenase catalytic domain-containing protein [Deltaproteobacteria bacterium]
MTMKAIVKSKPAVGIQVMDVPVPRPQADEVLVQVEAAGICGSDVHIYEWTSGYEFLEKYFPVTLGHEFSGVVVEVGPEAKSQFRPGERVTSETGKICGRCFYCQRGRGVLCERRLQFGRIGLERNGAMARFLTVPWTSLHRIPPVVSFEEAAMAEPAGVALGAVRTATIDPGDDVAILGPGPIGLMILQMCKARGAGQVMVFGLKDDKPRLKVAKELGADQVFIAGQEGTREAVLELTAGRGLAVVFEVSGSPKAAVSGLQMLRPTGELILVGIYSEPIPFDGTRQIVRPIRTIKGSWGAASQDWDRVLTMLANKKLNLQPLISKVLPVEQASEGFETIRRREGLKVLFKPGD